LYKPSFFAVYTRKTKYGYPPDLQDKATDLVLEQAELLATEWTA
jgi:hypothetical protein